jgi:RND family efflux transporter MFP subunit
MKRYIAVLPLILSIACQRHAAQLEKTVTPVRVSPVAVYQPKGGGRYSATLMPARQVALAFRVSGIVTGLYRVGSRGLDPGDIVNAGAVLAKLREEEYQNTAVQTLSQLEGARESRRTAQAQLAQATASRIKAEADFTRAKTLIESQSLTRPEFDAAKAALDVALAQEEQARAQIDAAGAQIRTAEASAASANLNQRDTALVAPFTAAVVQRNVELGSMAGPTQAAYTLADIGAVKAAFGVPDTVLVQLKPGKRLSVSVEALPAVEFHGAVTAIAAVADVETRLFQVEVTLANPKMLLRPGMIASLALTEDAAAQPVPVVPISAVVRDRSNPADFAIVVVENKIARFRRIGLGATFGDVLAVTEGVRPGEVVVRAGGAMIADGETVEVIP